MDKQETGVASQDAASMAEFLGEPPPSFWHRHRKWLLAGVAVLVVVFLVFGRGGDDEAVRYATAKVTRGNLEV